MVGMFFLDADFHERKLRMIPIKNCLLATMCMKIVESHELCYIELL